MGDTIEQHNKIEEKIIDVNIKIYESARTEIIQRIIIRDSALGLYIATVGSYLSTIIASHYAKDAKSTDIGYAIVSMLPFPVVCSAFSLIIIQHHLVIGRIGGFLKNEMNWGSIDGKISRHWDNSNSFLTQANYFIALRMYAQGLMLCLPFIYSIVFYVRYIGAARSNSALVGDLLSIQLIVNLFVAVFIVLLHIYAHGVRKEEWITPKQQP